MKDKIIYIAPVSEKMLFEEEAPVMELSDGRAIDTPSFYSNF